VQGELIHKEITEKVLGAAVEVHRHLGPGLLESAYEACLCHELDLRGLTYESQVKMPLEFKGLKIDGAYRLDLIVEGKIVIELKSVDALLPVHEAQLMTYLKLSGMKVGFLMNFNMPTLKEGIIRRVA
jgi:GxxExxY protein